VAQGIGWITYSPVSSCPSMNYQWVTTTLVTIWSHSIKLH